MPEHLSLPLRLPDEDQQAFERLATLTCRVATHVLERRWSPQHLDGIADADHQAWKYFDEHAPFERLDLYLPSRYRRCVLQKVGETLRSHAARRQAFQAVQAVLPDHKIRRIHRRRIKETLWEDGESLSSGYVDVLVDQLNGYYDRHGEYPDSYFDLQECPTYDSAALPYSADDGPTAGQAVRYDYDEATATLTVELKTPDTTAPATRGDWTWTTYDLDGYEAFADLVASGELSAPEFQPSRRKTGETYFELSFPVEVDPMESAADQSSEVETVLALDAGLRKDLTAVVVAEDGEQRSRPYFLQVADREKMARLHRERTRLNDRLGELRRRGEDHTEEFAHVHSEYEQVTNKIRHKREQYVHDLANQVLALALLFDVEAIVHEDLRSMSPPSGEGQLSWELSGWARRKLLEKIQYRAAVVGVAVDRVSPQGTSRSCPRCGATGHTTKSPEHAGEVWHGGHFRCDNARCEFEGDRDYAGALNVARVHFGETATLGQEFTASYTGASQLVPASRSAGARSGASQPTSDPSADGGTRLVVGTGVVAYTPADRARATVGGGSARVAPAVALPEPNADGSDGRGPTVRQCSRFSRIAVESC